MSLEQYNEKMIAETEDAVQHRAAEKRMQDVILFTLGTCQELKDRGLITSTPDSDRLTPAGMSLFFQLKADGFRYDPHECEWAMTMFKRYGGECDDALAAAAPDLLAVCKELLVVARNQMPEDGDFTEEMEDQLIAAEEAIAKAEGRE